MSCCERCNQELPHVEHLAHVYVVEAHIGDGHCASELPAGPGAVEVTSPLGRQDQSRPGGWGR
jgi:hypothetical protein